MNLLSELNQEGATILMVTHSVVTLDLLTARLIYLMVR